jgi:hypothetical protein
MNRGLKGGQRVGAQCTKKIAIISFACWLVLTPALWAITPAPSPKASESTAAIEKFCDDLISSEQNKAATNDATPKINLDYCKAAKSAKESANTNDLLWKVWLGVASVCTYACASSFIVLPSDQLLCMSATVGGGITEGVLTKELTTALTTILSVGGSYLINSITNPKPKEGAAETKQSTTTDATAHAKDAKTGAAPKEKDYGACMSAVTAIINVFTKYRAMEDQKKSANDNYLLAQKTDSEAQAMSGGYSTSIAANTPERTNLELQRTTAKQPTTTGQNPSSSGVSNPSNNCAAGVKSGTDTPSTLNCAFASDSKLPQWVTSPRFQKEFEKSGGQDLGDFLASKNQTLPQAMSGAMSGSMVHPDQASALANVLEHANERFNSDYDDSAAGYGRGHSGYAAKSSAESSGPDFNELLSGVMGQFLPKNGGAKDSATGSGLLDFGKLQRTPSSIFGDIKVSLFERVSTRYKLLAQTPVIEGGKR